jgi:ABC-type sugar transport system substrate-binding protein
MRRSPLLFVVALVAAAIAVSGCGSSASTTSTAGSATPAAASATTTPQAASAQFNQTPLLALPHVGPVVKPSVSGNTVSIDVGNGTPLKFKKGQKLNIALFVQTGAADFFKVAEQGAKSAAAKYGYGITTYDAQFDATTQRAQLQTAIASGKYNAFVFIGVDATLCDLATQTAPSKGILVAVYSNPTCGRDLAPDNRLWVPGTLNYTGALASGHDIDFAWVRRIAKDYPGPQKVVTITGPSAAPSVQSITQAVKAVAAQTPGWKATVLNATTYDAAGGLKEGQSWFQANPDTTLVIDNSKDVTTGVLAAMQADGVTGKAKVFVGAGDNDVVNWIKAGKVVSTRPYYPGSAASVAVQSLHDAVAGDSVPRIIINDGHPLTSFNEKTAPYLPYVTASPVKSGAYTPQQ